MSDQSQQLYSPSHEATGWSVEPLNSRSKLGWFLLVATVLALIALALLPENYRSTWNGVAVGEITGS